MPIKKMSLGGKHCYYGFVATNVFVSDIPLSHNIVLWPVC